MRFGVAALCLIALLAVPVSVAAPGSVDLQTQGLTMDGHPFDLAPESSEIQVEGRTNAMWIASGPISGVLHEWTVGSTAQIGDLINLGDPQYDQTPIEGGSAQVLAVNSNSVVTMALPDSAGEGLLTAPGAHAEPTNTPLRLYPDGREPTQGGVAGDGDPYSTYDSHVATGPRVEFAGPGLANYSGPIEIRLWETTLRVASGGGTTSYTSGHQESGPNDMPPSSETSDVYLWFIGHVENLTIPQSLAPIFLMQAAAMTGASSNLTFEGAVGEIEYGERTYRVDGSTVTVDARDIRMRLEAAEDFEQGAFRVTAEGDFSQVTVGGKAVSPGESGALAATAGVAATAAGAVSILGVLGALLYHLKVAPLWPALLRRAAHGENGREVVDALRNPHRRRILNSIRANPGIQPYHIWQVHGGGMGNTMRHLKKLESVGLVRTVRRGRNRHCYENSPTYEGDTLDKLATLARRTLNETYRVVQDHRPATQQQIAEALGVSVSTVCERLQQLTEAGLVECKRQDGVLHYDTTKLDVPRSLWERDLWEHNGNGFSNGTPATT